VFVGFAIARSLQAYWHPNSTDNDEESDDEDQGDSDDGRLCRSLLEIAWFPTFAAAEELSELDDGSELDDEESEMEEEIEEEIEAEEGLSNPRSMELTTC
jgi:hypothetical protein